MSHITALDASDADQGIPDALETDIPDVGIPAADIPDAGRNDFTTEEPHLAESTTGSSSTWHNLAIPAGVLIGIILLIIILILLVWFACPGICHRGQHPPIYRGQHPALGRFHSYLGQDGPPSYQESVLNPRPVYIIDRSTNVTNNQPRIVLMQEGQMPYIEEESMDQPMGAARADQPVGVARAYSLGTNRHGKRKGVTRSRSRRQTVDGSRIPVDYSSTSPQQRDSYNSYGSRPVDNYRRHIEGYRRHSLVNVYLHYPGGRRRSSVRRSSSLHIPLQYRQSVISNQALHRHSIASDMSQPPGYYEYLEHPALVRPSRGVHRHSIVSEISQPPGYFEYPEHQLVVPPMYNDIILRPVDGRIWSNRRDSYQQYETTRV